MWHKERVVTPLLLVGFFVSLVALYILTLQLPGQEVAIRDIDRSLTGQVVTIQGTISDVRTHKDGHLFLTVDDGTGTLTVAVWSDVVEVLALRGFDLTQLTEGRNLTVTGSIDFYKGEPEMVPLKFT